jgi:hypothetical protein
MSTPEQRSEVDALFEKQAVQFHKETGVPAPGKALKTGEVLSISNLQKLLWIMWLKKEYGIK